VDHLLRSVEAEMEYRVVFDKDQLKKNFHILPEIESLTYTVPSSGTSTGGPVSIRIDWDRGREAAD